MREVVYEGQYVPLRGVRMSAAFDSILHISFDVRGGLLVRQTQHRAALVFVAALGLHPQRIFFTGAFRRPREVNWVIGGRPGGLPRHARCPPTEVLLAKKVDGGTRHWSGSAVGQPHRSTRARVTSGALPRRRRPGSCRG
jgi:Cytochrome b(N-terminal)/b6/petB